MELSIIVPVYNMAGDDKLEYCLNSLLNQTISDYEIIAVDDASTDNTPRILLDYAADYPDVFKVFFCRERRMLGGAKNLGLKHARGRFVGFVDSDDWVALDMYEKLLKKARETGADVVSCDYHLVQSHSEDFGQVVQAHTEEELGELDEEKRKRLLLHAGTLVNRIYRRKVICDCGMQFPEHILFENNAIANAIVLRAKKYAYVPEPLYAYYQHADSAAHATTKEQCSYRMEAARVMLQHAKDFGYLETYRDEIEFKFAELFYVNTLACYLKGSGKKDADFIRNLKREMEENFPDFEKNPYYKEKIGAEGRRLMHLHQRGTRRKLLLQVGGILIGVLLFLLLAQEIMRDDRSLQKRIVLLGDSVVANDYVGEDLHEMLAKGLGEDVFNGGFGGSYMSNPNREYYETMGDESLSMEALANSMITGDFSAQKASIQRASRLDYFEERLETLSQIDFDKTEILIIEHCVNDYALQIPPEEMGKALRRVLTGLCKEYPGMQIVVSSPTYCYITKDGEKLYCDTAQPGGYVLEEYVLQEQKVCEELGITFVDNYRQDVITRQTIEQYSIDGLHLNEAGRQFMADNILAALQSLEQEETERK